MIDKIDKLLVQYQTDRKAKDALSLQPAALLEAGGSRRLEGT